MDTKRLRVGTKIIMLTDNEFQGYHVGSKGVLCDDSMFNIKGQMTDRNGAYWAKIQGAYFTRCCIRLSAFKVTRY